MTAGASHLAHAIQLAVAPVFLLTAIGGFLAAMTARLSRVIDRARLIEAAMPAEGPLRQAAVAELATLDRRMVLTNRAVSLSVSSGLLLCVLIALLFLAALFPENVAPEVTVPVLFIIVLLLLVAGLTSFLVEIRISIRTLRVRAELVAGAPPPPGDIALRRAPSVDQGRA